MQAAVKDAGPVMPESITDPANLLRHNVFYFTLGPILASPARTQTSSLSPPGAPETAKTPTMSEPAMIGTAPWRAVSIMGLAATSALKAGSAAALAATS